jgi:DNA-directed RNA polymerase subunit RPC12/RpoP
MTVRCSNCRAELEDDDALEAHIRDEHSTSEDSAAIGKRVTCPQCGAEMSPEENLEVHMHDAHAA